MNAEDMLSELPGKLNFPLFLSLMSGMLKESAELGAKLTDLFDTLDEDGNGYVRMELLNEAVPGIAEKVKWFTYVRRLSALRNVSIIDSC